MNGSALPVITGKAAIDDHASALVAIVTLTAELERVKQQLKEIRKEAEVALSGDSNDEEHDALVKIAYLAAAEGEVQS